MKRSSIFLLTLIGALPPALTQAATLEIPTDISQKGKPQTIKILLTKLASEATVEVKGRFRVYSNGQLMGTVKDKWERIVYTDSGIRWGDLYPATFKLRVVPADEHAVLLVNNTPYRGCLEIFAIGGTVNIVSEIDVENYLKETLPGKIAEALDREVLDALVIVERTNLAYLAQKHPQSTWQIAADKAGYVGNAAHNAAIDAAVERTRGTVMQFHNQLFPATWTEHAAGRTASFAAIYRKAGQMPEGVQSLPSKSTKEEVKWSASVPSQLIAELSELDQVSQVELYKAEGSSKVYALRFSDGASSQNIDFFRFQQAVGPKIIRSNDFTAKIEGDTLVISGFGDGAGVGLCLASAQILAEHQEDARKILVTHFPGVQLNKLSAPHDELTAYIWK